MPKKYKRIVRAFIFTGKKKVEFYEKSALVGYDFRILINYDLQKLQNDMDAIQNIYIQQLR